MSVCCGAQTLFTGDCDSTRLGLWTQTSSAYCVASSLRTLTATDLTSLAMHDACSTVAAAVGAVSWGVADVTSVAALLAAVQGLPAAGADNTTAAHIMDIADALLGAAPAVVAVSAAPGALAAAVTSLLAATFAVIPAVAPIVLPSVSAGPLTATGWPQAVATRVGSAGTAAMVDTSASNTSAPAAAFVVAMATDVLFAGASVRGAGPVVTVSAVLATFKYSLTIPLTLPVSMLASVTAASPQLIAASIDVTASRVTQQPDGTLALHTALLATNSASSRRDVTSEIVTAVTPSCITWQSSTSTWSAGTCVVGSVTATRVVCACAGPATVTVALSQSQAAATALSPAVYSSLFLLRAECV